MSLLFENRSSRLKAYIAAVCLIAILLCGILISSIFNRQTFYSGISIDGESMSGLTLQQARDFLEQRTQKLYVNKRLFLSNGDKTWDLALDDISYRYQFERSLTYAYEAGRSGNLFQRLSSIVTFRFNPIDIPIGADFDQKRLRTMLEGIKKQIDKDPVNAEILYKSGKVTVNPDSKGMLMDVDKNLKIVENEIGNKKFNVALSIDETLPDIEYEEVKDINHVLSTFTTRFNAGDLNRTHNIKLACERINGTLLMPGDIFSMNKGLGPRTLDNGYKNAPVIYMNELVPGPGGGVCQVTTSLYGAVLLAKADVVDRTNHTMPLGYVPLGQDATIAEDYIDFKFQNSKDYPIVINAEVLGSNLNIRLLGKKPDVFETVKLQSVVTEQYPPSGIDIIVDNSVPEGAKIVTREAKQGIKVVVYRETYDKTGKLLQKEKISEDDYKPIKQQIKVNENYRFKVHS